MAVMADVPTAERVQCPVCAGRGRIHGRAFGRLIEGRHVCGLCGGSGTAHASRSARLPLLRAQMQRVADLMQAGDTQRAACASRVAFRIAASMMPHQR
jgi:uncharacterized membrane protein (DUF2068 family)